MLADIRYEYDIMKTKPEIHQWSEIKNQYEKPDLLLGNGFSIMIDPNFTYEKIFESFVKRVDAGYHNLFRMFDTTNFEHILKCLNYAFKVNECLNLPVCEIQQAIDILKSGLIETISAINFDRSIIESLEKELQDIFAALEDFNDIYTTNYDSLLYYIILKRNKGQKTPKGEDAYIDLFSKQPKSTKPLDSADNSIVFNPNYFWQKEEYSVSKRVYYLHGALFLYSAYVSTGETLLSARKATCGGGGIPLNEIIKNNIKKGKFPLFVSEGTQRDKLKVIENNQYLRDCFDNLKNSEKSLLVFGNSLSLEDDHIVTTLVEKPRDIVVALYYNKDRSSDELHAQIFELRDRFNKRTEMLTDGLIKMYPKSICFVYSDGVF